MRNLNLTDVAKVVFGSPIIGALATTNGDCDYVSLKNYDRCTIVIAVDNATTVTGGAVTLKQSTNVTNSLSDEKAVAFDKVFVNLDAGAGDTLTETAVTSDTFTTLTTNDKNALYVIEIKASDLDVSGGFDCLRVDVLSMANASGAVLYFLHGARYGDPKAIAAITN